MYLWIVIASAIVLIDQISKILVSANISFTDQLTLIPGFIDVVYVKNTGAAFSILNEYTWLLGALSLLVSVAIIVYMIKTKPTDKLTVISAGLILGGAVGNGIDRILRQYVVDFLEFAFINFPVFNVADIGITVGACLIILSVLISEKREKKNKWKRYF